MTKKKERRKETMGIEEKERERKKEKKEKGFSVYTSWGSCQAKFISIRNAKPFVFFFW